MGSGKDSPPDRACRMPGEKSDGVGEFPSHPDNRLTEKTDIIAQNNFYLNTTPCPMGFESEWVPFQSDVAAKYVAISIVPAIVVIFRLLRSTAETSARNVLFATASIMRRDISGEKWNMSL